LKVALEVEFETACKEFFADLSVIPDLSGIRAVYEAMRRGATIYELRKLL
jgi:hypothetical protein